MFKLLFSVEFLTKIGKFFASIINTSKIIQFGVSIAIVILALSFGAALFNQSKNNCFSGFFINAEEENFNL